MTKHRFKCKVCGEILVGDHARRMHCQIHHPAVAFSNLDIFYPREFVEIGDSKSEENIELQKPVHLDTAGRIVKGKRQTIKPIQLSKIIPQEYRPKNVPFGITSTQSKDLFEYAVSILANGLQTNPNILDPKTKNQWMNYCFPREKLAFRREDYMTKIKSEFGIYFTPGLKYTFDFEKIKRDFPDFFIDGEKRKIDDIDAMIQAIRTEILHNKEPKNRKQFKVQSISGINRSKKTYKLSLSISDSDLPVFGEGFGVELLVDGIFYECECIEYDDIDSVLYVTANKLIYGGNEGMLFVDMTFILEAILKRLILIKDNGFDPKQPGYKFIKSTYSQVSKIIYQGKPFTDIIETMDESQRTAINGVLTHDLSFVWGPPGTGKSFTLSGLINILYRNKENTLVCCISNVAVDQLLNKVIDEIERLKFKPMNCEIMRAGHTTDNRLLDTKYLYPNDFNTDQLRRKIREINEKINTLRKRNPKVGVTEQELNLLQERISLRDELKNRIENLIKNANVTFTTIANYVLSASLEEKNFDNLIVDEASMLSMPFLLALCTKIFKRVILVGDPNQLGPIALFPDKLLKKSVFDQCGILDDSKYPSLYKLVVQRRSHERIVRLTNDVFYDGILKAVNNFSPAWVFDSPFPGKIIKIINQDIENDEAVPVGTSRRNFGNCNKVMEILDDIFANRIYHYSIGIITPFRAQVRLYMGKIRQKYDDTGFWQDIKVGTVHTFQGSECDLIIFDLVECTRSKGRLKTVSKLFHNKDGERLVNVALSRAKHKLIVVGDTKRFDFASGTCAVSYKVARALTRITDVDALSDSAYLQ